MEPGVPLRIAAWIYALGVSSLLVVSGCKTLPAGFPARPPRDLVIEVQAGDHDRYATPITVPWSAAEMLDRGANVELVREDNGEIVPAQFSEGMPPELVWLLSAPLKAGESRRYRMRNATSSPESLVYCCDDGRRLHVHTPNRVVLAYNHRTIEPPRGVDAVYRRSGHMHPVFNPEGQTVTDDFAPDHAHQHGVFFAWTNTKFRDYKVDFWNQGSKTGTVEHRELLSTASGPVFAQFEVELGHLDVTDPANPHTVLLENWTVRVFHREDVFLFDLRSAQRCAGDEPLDILEYHYGGMALRGHRQWLLPESADSAGSASGATAGFLTGEGKTRANGNQSRPGWVRMHGEIDGRSSGIAVFDHPDNFRSPQPVRLHPTKPDFRFAPLALGDFRLEPDKWYFSRYRLCVQMGKLTTTDIDPFWHDDVDPPRVRITSASDS
jgi:hypothetical protein